MFFQKASDPVEEVTVAEVAVVVEVITGALAEQLRDHRGQAPRHRGLTAVRHERVQHGQAVRYGKSRTR
jgi:hypothetical protein